MTTFLEASACKGRRPDEAASLIHYPRHDLVTRLLVERDVPRFIVAPDGFGKTSLLAEYCDMMTGFTHTFWINGRSPYFMRDLDACSIAADVAAIDRNPCVVVFEDIPRFSVERSQAFSALLDELLSKGNEVLVSCQPSGDVYGDLHRDRLMLTAEDLTLSDEESNVATKIDRSSPMHLFPVSERIACLRWSTAGGKELLEGIRREDLPQDWLLVMAFMLVLNTGTLADVKRILEPARAEEAWDSLAGPYGFLGIDRQEGEFRTSVLGVSAIAKAVAPQLRKHAHLSLQGDFDGFVGAMADALIERDNPTRAAKVLSNLGSYAGSTLWLKGRGWGLLESGQFLALLEVYDAIVRTKHGVDAEVTNIAACALTAMFEPDEALRFAARSFRRSEVPQDILIAASLRLFLGDGVRSPDFRMKLEAALAAETSALHADGIQESREAFLRLTCALLILNGMGSSYSCDPGLVLLSQKVPQHLRAVRMVASLCATKMLESNEGGLWSDDTYSFDITKLLYAVKDDAEYLLKKSQAPWLAAETALALCRASEALKESSLCPDSEMCRKAREIRDSVLSQRGMYAHVRRKEERSKDLFEKTHPDPFRRSAVKSVAQSILTPILHVKLFGGLRIRIGDKEVSQNAFSKRKARLLLALLVLKNGNEESKDYIAQLFWPESSPRQARKNLYTTIGILKHALEVDGDCPYIVCDTATIRLDTSIVSTDLSEFNELCNALLGSSYRVADWEAVFNAINTTFAADLLPSEHDNFIIDKARLDCRTNLVEALVAASRQQLRDGAPQVSLRLAREAFRRDSCREDVYAAKMAAEKENGLREEAMNTYFACRTYLTDRLGIDPSPVMVEMYQELLVEEITV